MNYHRFKISTSLLVIVILLTTLGQPSFGKSKSNAAKALALSYSGCTFGMLQWTSSKMKIKGLDLDAEDVKNHLEMVVMY